MKVTFEEEWTDLPFHTLYYPNESSFGPSKTPLGGITSVLINYLQIEVNTNGQSLYLWGLFGDLKNCTPIESYLSGAPRRVLRFGCSQSWLPGVSVRLNERSWAQYIDLDAKVVGALESERLTGAENFEFCPSCFVSIREGRVIGIWISIAETSGRVEDTHFSGRAGDTHLS